MSIELTLFSIYSLNCVKADWYTSLYNNWWIPIDISYSLTDNQKLVSSFDFTLVLADSFITDVILHLRLSNNY